MKQKDKPVLQRMKEFPLWQWGLLLIFAAVMANMLLGMIAPITGNSAAARGQAFGRGLASLLTIITGVVLIVMHFVRRKRS